MKNTRPACGFSLIELMITVAIVGILAAVAIPSYEHYVRDARRTDAKDHLMMLSQAMENFYGVNFTYEGTADSDGKPKIYHKQVPVDQDTKYYDLKIEFDSENNSINYLAYRLKAVPIAGSAQANDRCGTLIYESTGNKSVSVTGQDRCW